MIRVFKKKYPDAKISMTGGEVTLIMDFGDSSSAARRK
jgi:hypothetical protein